MKLLAYDGGYVNAEWLESYELREDDMGWVIRAYKPRGAETYVLGRFPSEDTAQKSLDSLAEWLASMKGGVLDMTGRARV